MTRVVTNIVVTTWILSLLQAKHSTNVIYHVVAVKLHTHVRNKLITRMFLIKFQTKHNVR